MYKNGQNASRFYCKKRKIQKENTCLRRESNQRLLVFQPGALDRLVTGTDVSLCLQLFQNLVIWIISDNTFIKLSFKCNKTYVPVDKQYKTPYWKARDRWFDSRRTHTMYIFILNYSLVSRSSQLDRAHANEIKRDNSPVLYVFMDPRYD